MATATLKVIADYFKLPGETLKDFRDQWERLSDKDKADLKNGLGDGTLNY
jgi:hypothetical protein